MKHTEIEAIMSAKVAEYITKGYILNTTTMSGHQGEIAKVDVKKGNEIIRILLTSESSWDDEGTIQKTTLTVGRAQKQIRKSCPFDTMCTTIWNHELDIIEEHVWYSVDRNADYFSEDKAEIIAQHKKQIKRWRIRTQLDDMKVAKLTSEAAMQIALRFIRRQPRCSRMKLTDIASIRRFSSSDYDKMHYSVKLVNGKTYKIA